MKRTLKSFRERVHEQVNSQRSPDKQFEQLSIPERDSSLQAPTTAANPASPTVPQAGIRENQVGVNSSSAAPDNALQKATNHIYLPYKPRMTSKQSKKVSKPQYKPFRKNEDPAELPRNESTAKELSPDDPTEKPKQYKPYRKDVDPSVSELQGEKTRTFLPFHKSAKAERKRGVSEPPRPSYVPFRKELVSSEDEDVAKLTSQKLQELTPEIPDIPKLRGSSISSSEISPGARSSPSHSRASLHRTPFAVKVKHYSLKPLPALPVETGSEASISRPQSKDSMLPSPLRVVKKPTQRETENKSKEPLPPKPWMRDMYSFEDLSFQALVDEVSASPGRPNPLKLPFVKRQSWLNLKRSQSERSPRRASFSSLLSKVSHLRPSTASTVASTTLDSVKEEDNIEESTKPLPSPPAVKPVTSNEAFIIEAFEEGEKGSAAPDVAASNRKPSPEHLALHPLRKFIPTRLRGTDDSAPVRTADGHRIFQLCEAVYDEDNQVTYRPFLPLSINQDDTRLFVIPMSRSEADVINWGTGSSSDGVRGEVFLGTSITGELQTEEVVFVGQGMNLADLERGLKRSETKRQANFRRATTLSD